MAEINLFTCTTSYTYNGTTYTFTGRIYADYTITESATAYTINSSIKLGYSGSGWTFVSAEPNNEIPNLGYWQLNNDTQQNFGKVGTMYSAPVTLSTSNKSVTITKTHSAQSIPLDCHLLATIKFTARQQYSGRIVKYVSTSGRANTAYFTVPAKASYTITYNANGGQNPPASQTKWYGETLTLQTAQPVKEGYTFKGWAVSQDNANAGIVTYASGGSYTGNVSINLFAVWELTYQKPTIYRLTVERCQHDGTLDDEGTYALVSFDWAVFRSAESRYYGGNTYPYANNSVETCTVTVGTQSVTPTLTGASGHSSVIVGVGSYDVDTAYDATVSITDSQELSIDNTTTVSGSLPMAFFPLDYNADATALGIFMPAPNDGNGAYFGKTIHIAVETSASIGTTDYEILDALDDLGWNDLLE